MEDFSKYQTAWTGGKIHYNSVLEELVMTRGGERVRQEYRKLLEDKTRLIEILDNVLTDANIIGASDGLSSYSKARELLKEMED